jgi:hypothetical protein
MAFDSSTHTIECIAVIGKNNNPLYVKNFTNRPDLDLHYFVYISLDAIEERCIKSHLSTDSYFYSGRRWEEWRTLPWYGLFPGEFECVFTTSQGN